MLDKFYPIVPDVGWLKRIVPLGVKTIQLRIKNADDASIRSQISESLDVCDKYDCTLIVNDYWQAAIALGAAYIHLGQEDLLSADLNRIRNAEINVGISTHSHDELRIALAAEPDYVALGPIYETKLKKMKWQPQGLDRITEWKGLIDCPLIAIGGITVERAETVLEAGASSIAVVTDFITHRQPDERIRQWLNLLD